MGEKRFLAAYAAIAVGFVALLAILDHKVEIANPAHGAETASTDSRKRTAAQFPAPRARTPEGDAGAAGDPSSAGGAAAGNTPAGDGQRADEQADDTIVLLGASDHGKGELLSAVGDFMNEDPVVSETARGDAGAGAQGVAVKMSRLEIQGGQGRRKIIDFATHLDHVKGLLVGVASPRGGIVVVSALHGVMPDTRRAVLMAQSLGIHVMAAFINDVDSMSDEELIDLVEAETREVLSAFRFAGEEIPVIRGSASAALRGDAAWRAKIGDLVKIIDAYSAPAPAGRPRPRATFDAEVYLYGGDEGGRRTPAVTGYSARFDVGGRTESGRLVWPTGVELAMPGDYFPAQVRLAAPVEVSKGARFSILEDGRVVGRGVVSAVPE